MECRMLVRTRSALPCSIVVCFLVASLVSCTAVIPTITTLNIGDGGFLSGDPCGPPCFWGIVPGQTTEAEVVDILQERGIYEICEARVSKYEEGGKGIDCILQIYINLNQGDDLVRSVYFAPSAPITVQEVIAKYGEPDGILVYPEGVPEHPRISLYIVYSSILSRLELPVQEWPGYVVQPSTPVLSILYDLKYSDVQDSPFFEKWVGYGEY